MAIEQATRTIPISKPFFGPEEMAIVQKPLESGWVVQGPYVKAFETAFSEFTGASFAVATSSCTTALHGAVAALGLQPGDEVIVPSFTWVATANVVEHMGARPVFCDIELSTFNLDVAQLSGLITERTVGIIPVHLFGLCADIAPVVELAKHHHLWVLEDAACAFGSWYHGTHAGLFGDAACFSFHPRKSITTGEGGMITTADPELDRLCRSLRNHGVSWPDTSRRHEQATFLVPDHAHLGFNFRMTDVQGALGCAQMERAPDILAARGSLARRYDDLLADVDWLQVPVVPEGYVHGYQAYVCLFHPQEPTLANVERLHQQRNALMTGLEERGVGTRQGTHAATLQGYYVEKYGLRPEDFPVGYLADRLSLALPLYAQMTPDDQEYVIESLQAVKEQIS